MPKQAQIAGQVLNRSEMAGFLAVSPVTLDRWTDAGCPIMERGKTSQGSKYNSGDVVKWLRARESEAKEGDSGDARRRFTAASADLKELQLAEKRKLMISVEDVAPIVADELANVRSRLLAMPGRLAPAVTGMTDQAKVEAAIRDEVIAALSELTADQ